MQMLYVENHARFARLTVEQFLCAHEVVVASSLATARKALTESTFDVVLIDYDLDDGKGTELVQELQALPPHRPLIIAVSAHERGNEALLAAGADAVCDKLKFANIEVVLKQAVLKQAVLKQAMDSN